MAKKVNSFMSKYPLLARVINVPEELNTLVTAWVMAGFLWAEMWLTQFTQVDFSGFVAAVGVAVAAFLTFGFKALLERWVPEAYHEIVNAVLKWVASLLTGGALVHFMS